MKTAALGLLAALLAGPPALRLEVYPRLGTSPQDVHIRVWVERDAANRWLEVRMVSAMFGRSTGVQLEGDLSPAVFEWWWKSFPCGSYVARAQVTRVDGRTQNANSHARFVGFECD